MSDPTLDLAKAIVGMPGAGKSYTARVDVEQLAEEHRHFAVIDPTGVWYGLRSNDAGTGAGFDIPIFGGEHGDVPIRPIDGAAIAGIIADQRVSAIIDLSEIHDSAEQRAFMDDFVARLRQKPRANFHLILDEAHEFAPEQLPDKEAHRLRENITWLQKSGRTRGFVLTLITQRPADIAKRVLNLAQTIVVHRLIAPGDQKVVSDYLKAHASGDTRDQVMSSLAQLGVGERWVYSPGAGILDRGVTRPIRTFDSMKTPAPGETKLEPRTLAQLDVSAIRDALAGTHQRNEALRVVDEAGSALAEALMDRDREIAELKRELAETEAELENSNEAGVQMIDTVLKAIDLLKSCIFSDQEIPGVGPGNAAGSGRSDLPAARNSDLAADGGEGAAAVGGIQKAAANPQRLNGREVGPIAAEMPRMTQRLIEKLAEFYPRSLPIEHLAKIAGVGIKSSQWRDHFRAFRESGLVEELRANGHWQISRKGVAALGLRPRPKAADELLDFWRKAFTPAVGNMLAVLVEQREWMTPETIATWAGVSPTSSTLGSGLKELRDHGLAERRQDGAYRATEVLL